jgi:hypothetical protein
MNCDKCKHDHAGEELGFVCVGCPCPERPKKPLPACLACSNKAARYCRSCAIDVAIECYDEDPVRDSERDDVVAFLKQCAVDYERCGTARSLEELIGCLEREEHRR